MPELDTVENAYRVHLGWALPTARAVAGEADDPFAVTRRAMEADAWDGGESADFYQQCMQHGSSAATAADECLAALEGRFRAEPPQVAPSDRRARFS